MKRGKKKYAIFVICVVAALAVLLFKHEKYLREPLSLPVQTLDLKEP